MDVVFLPVSQISRRSDASVREEELWRKSLTTSLAHPDKSADLEDPDFSSDGQEEEESPS